MVFEWAPYYIALTSSQKQSGRALRVCWLDIKHGKGCVSDVHLLERVSVGQGPQLSPPPRSTSVSRVSTANTLSVYSSTLRTYVLYMYLNYITTGLLGFLSLKNMLT